MSRNKKEYIPIYF